MAFLIGLPMEEIGMHLLAGGVALVIGFALFPLGWIGGGDAKFAAAAALWIGWSNLMAYAVYFSLLGGALTLLVVLARSVPLQMVFHFEWVRRLQSTEVGIPYGIALAAAGLIVYPSTVWMAAY